MQINIYNIFKKYIKKVKKVISELLLAILAYLLYYTIKFLIPIHVASTIGYALGYILVARFPLPRKKEVLKNIQLAFPDKSYKEVKKIYVKSCINFTQNIFELPKLNKIMNDTNYFNIKDNKNTLSLLEKTSIMVFSAHYGNWELIVSPYVKNPNSYSVYKAPKNTWLENFFLRMRKVDGYQMNLFTLNAKSILNLNREIKTKNIILGMMTDQRILEGIEVKFFNRIAKTSPLLPLLSIKYNLPLIPAFVKRIGFCKFELEVFPPLEINQKYYEKENQAVGISLLTQKMNDTIQFVIQNDPNQWFWLHKRW
jgi:KDO2-lipid IV(A) lauroyltransferase